MRKLLKTIVKSWYFKVGLIALVLRLALMPITFHPDFISLNSSRFYPLEEKVWNFYDFLASLSDNHPLSENYGRNYYTYPPLSYFTFGFFSLLLKPFYGNDITPWLIDNYPKIFSHPRLFRQLFLFKLPYLVFDFGIAYLLVKFFSQEKNKKRAFLLWLFNPVCLYSAYMVGQFELMPTFFVVLALFLAQKKKENLAALSLGVGGAYKMFPLFFVPILAFAVGKTAWQKLKLFVLGLVPFLVSILPFIKSPVFRQVVLFSSQSEKFLHMSLPVSGAEGIFVFVFLWGLVFFLSAYQEKAKDLLWLWFLAITLAFFALTHYHPQWFLWLVPLLVIQLVKTKFKFSFLTGIMIASWLAITLFFESSLNYGLFVPLKPSLWEAPSLAEIVNQFYNVFQLKSIARSLFAAASVIMVVFTFKSLNEKRT